MNISTTVVPVRCLDLGDSHMFAELASVWDCAFVTSNAYCQSKPKQHHPARRLVSEILPQNLTDGIGPCP